MCIRDSRNYVLMLVDRREPSRLPLRLFCKAGDALAESNGLVCDPKPCVDTIAVRWFELYHCIFMYHCCSSRSRQRRLRAIDFVCQLFNSHFLHQAFGEGFKAAGNFTKVIEELPSGFENRTQAYCSLTLKIFRDPI